MSIRVRWFDQAKTTICLLYDGIWTWDDYYVAHEQAHKLAETTTRPVYLYHVTNDTPIPSGALPHMKRVAMETAHWTQHTIIIADDLFFRAMFQMFCKFASDWAEKYTLASSLDDARRIRLQHNRSRASS